MKSNLDELKNRLTQLFIFTFFRENKSIKMKTKNNEELKDISQNCSENSSINHNISKYLESSSLHKTDEIIDKIAEISSKSKGKE